MARVTKKKFWAITSAVGVLIYLIDIIDYGWHGFKPTTLFWLSTGLICLCLAAFRLSSKTKPLKTISRHDLMIAGALVLVLAPFYICKVHDIPRQLNPDETVIVHVAGTAAHSSNTDLLGPGSYYGLPNLVFWVFGKLAVAMGGVNLQHIRLLNAIVGILTIGLCYLLFRQFLKPLPSLVASLVIAFNHSFFFISRMAMRDNSAVLIEVAALVLLVIGWRKKHYGWSFLGGIISGLTFYTYYSARFTFVIWVAFVVAQAALKKFRGVKDTLKLSAVALVGFIIIITPLLVGNSRHHQGSSSYAVTQFMWSKEGRRINRDWRSAPSETSAILTNIKKGLLAFNRPYPDGVNVYDHLGFGFVDMLTGAMLWVGIAAIIIGWIKRKSISDGDLLALAGFLVIWLSLALLFYKAPDYTRMLVILPFIAYLSVRGLRTLVKPIAWLFAINHRVKLESLLLVLFALTVFGLNVFIIRDYINTGRARGDALGDTVRFEEKHAKEQIGYFYVPQNQYSYLAVGNGAAQTYWLSVAKSDKQPLVSLIPNELLGSRLLPENGQKQAYILTNDDVWQTYRHEVIINYDILSKINLTPDGRILAVKIGSK